jgi:hypothetical protein
MGRSRGAYALAAVLPGQRFLRGGPGDPDSESRAGCREHVVGTGRVDDNIARPIQYDHGAVRGQPLDDRAAN